MVSEPHDWTVPAPLRALLWWPPLAFLLVLLEPNAAAITIAVAGAALAVFGVAGAAVGRAITRRRAPSADEAPTITVAAEADRPLSVAVEQRAA
jgi:hypothetical protein